MADGRVKTRKTRFVCISDTHNAFPGGAFKLPKGDVLIHAGDLTNQGTFKELQQTLNWIEDSEFDAKIVIAANHDITLDSSFYNQYGPNFHNQDPQDAPKCQKLLEESNSITYLRHDSATIKLRASNGPQATFKIFGSPYSPAKGMWAFGYEPHEAPQLWDKIPLDTDIVVSHTPPRSHLDERSDHRAVGCEALRCRLWTIRPRLAICGHVHEGRGAETITWDLTQLNSKYKEKGVTAWNDPGMGNKKISLVDLTTKGGSKLDNDGSCGDHDHVKEQDEIEREPRCDLEALTGRMGRKETCVINAAIMASSWPHNGNGGERFNKAIVVDIDLPVCEV